MPTYSADQIVDKFLYVKHGKTVKVYNSSLQEIKVLKGGDYVGQVYSWISRGGSIYWELYNRTYVKHVEGVFTDISEQGALTVEEVAAKGNETEKKFPELKTLFLLSGAIIITYNLLDYLKKQK